MYNSIPMYAHTYVRLCVKIYVSMYIHAHVHRITYFLDVLVVVGTAE